jgi:hypothetical protein
MRRPGEDAEPGDDRAGERLRQLLDGRFPEDVAGEPCTGDDTGDETEETTAAEPDGAEHASAPDARPHEAEGTGD